MYGMPSLFQTADNLTFPVQIQTAFAECTVPRKHVTVNTIDPEVVCILGQFDIGDQPVHHILGCPVVHCNRE